MASEVSLEMAECPECSAALRLPRGTVVGEILPCGECLAELEVTALEPPTLTLAPEIEEDWGE